MAQASVYSAVPSVVCCRSGVGLWLSLCVLFAARVPSERGAAGMTTLVQRELCHIPLPLGKGAVLPLPQGLVVRPPW